MWLCTRVHTAGIRELRSRLAPAVRRAASGERTVITAHGRPVAQLAPLDEAAPDIDRLISSGALVPPRRSGLWRPPAAVAVWSGVRIDRALRELRG
ncbi:MAG TPA: type II toxin-antitoxin system prevent-host-death family antitoxin [Ilumatobacter sp.]|nr:type II toxin-antitoxin system prevent-host-death family antitoxin [Ilumatobacter sp.]